MDVNRAKPILRPERYLRNLLKKYPLCRRKSVRHQEPSRRAKESVRRPPEWLRRTSGSMRILGGSKRRNRSFTVYQIPNSHILQDPGQFDIFPSLGKLKKPAPCPFFYRRLQVYLQGGFRKDDRANVPAYHHHTRLSRPVFQSDEPLFLGQCLPDLAVGCHNGDNPVDLGAANGPGYVQFTDLDRRLAAVWFLTARRTDANRQLFRHAANSLTVGAADSSVLYSPSHCTIHDSGIEEEKAQALANQEADSALAGCCRPINCYRIHRDHLNKRGNSQIGWACGPVSWLRH